MKPCRLDPIVLSKTACEKGQVFVLGAILICIILLIMAYFVYLSEVVQRSDSNSNRSLFLSIQKSSKVSLALNQIALNNVHILSALSLSEEAFIKAMELGLYVGYTQPYWETYQNILSDKSKKILSKELESYALKSARGFFLAKALSEKNNLLIQENPKLLPYFTRATNAQTTCLALESWKKDLGYPGLLKYSHFELYSFYLESEFCSLKHSRNRFQKVLNALLPFLSSTEKDFILSYSDFENFLPDYQKGNFGIWFVSIDFAWAFVQSLQFDTKKELSSEERNNYFSVVTNALSKISFFSQLHLNVEKNNAHVPFWSRVRISHPSLSCEKKEMEDFFVREEDWAVDCSLDESKFLRAFFQSNWSPIVTKFQEKTQESGDEIFF